MIYLTRVDYGEHAGYDRIQDLQPSHHIRPYGMK